MDQPIAVFDSGIGGLSVVRHLREHVPAADIVYYGDTARVPYGTKSAPTVQRFSLEIAHFLLQFKPRLLVVACNTASALALRFLQEQLTIPVIGVVEPGARLAVALAGKGPIAILGTEATIASRAYETVIERLAPGMRTIGRACPLFVPLAEEGRPADDPVVQVAVADYLADLPDCDTQAAILGCTHYPLLTEAIARELGEGVAIIDSGAATATAVRDHLKRDSGLPTGTSPGSLRCFVSDNPNRFRAVGSRFLKTALSHVEYVPPEQYVSAAQPFPS
jgi:glutamate racemase